MNPDPGDPPLAALAAWALALGAARLWELRLSARHARVLAGRGGVEVGRRHFPIFVLLHTLFPLAVIAEALVLGARPPRAWWLWLALLIGAQALRIWAIRSLGVYWNVRIRVAPGMERVRRGPYRFLSHPNYAAVAIEIAAAALMFGAWRAAAVCSALNLAALAIRIPAEERALAAATGSVAASRPGPGSGARTTGAPAPAE